MGNSQEVEERVREETGWSRRGVQKGVEDVVGEAVSKELQEKVGEDLGGGVGGIGEKFWFG